MNKLFPIQSLFILAAIAFTGCGQKKTLDIFIENGSASEKIISVDIYVNDSLVSTAKATQFEGKVSSKHVRVNIPPVETFRIGFKIPGTSYETACTIRSKELSDKMWMHVLLQEVVFEKGWNLYGRILDKDTIVERGFSCGLVEQPLCGFIEE